MLSNLNPTRSGWAIIAVIIATPLAGLWFGLQAAFPRDAASVRYGVEFTLDIGTERVSGRTVLEGHFAMPKSWIPGVPGGGMTADVYGDAVPIAVPGLGTVFILRREVGKGPRQAAGAWILACIPGGSTELRAAAIPSYPPCETTDRKPMVVINRGTTAVPLLEELDYTDKGGPVTLVNIAIAVTDEPVTRGVATDFPWIKSLPAMTFPWRARISSGPAYREDFTR